MLILTQRIDIIPNGRKKEFWLNQYDEDFIIRFELFSSEGTFSIPSGTTAAIRGTKPDGNGYSADAVIDGNTVTVEGDQQITVAAGKAVFELTLYKDGKELNSANFILHIERAPLDKDTPSSRSQTRELVSIEAHADELIAAATDINAKASDSEAYAVGTRSGTTVESTDPAYHNNSKYYAESLTGDLAPAFSESAAYTTGDYVIKDGKLYKFTADHAAGAWTGTDAAEAQLAGDVSDLKDDLSEITGLSDDVKEALLACFVHVAWIDEDGQDYYDALETALYGGNPPAYWDYEWEASPAGTLPPGMTVKTGTPSYDSATQSLLVNFPDMNFEYVGDGILEMELSAPAESGNNYFPQFHAPIKYDGNGQLREGLVFVNADSNKKIYGTVSGAGQGATDLNVDQTAFHKIKMEVKNGTCDIHIDDNFVGAGYRVSGNAKAFGVVSGVVGATPQYIKFKSIRFKMGTDWFEQKEWCYPGNLTLYSGGAAGKQTSYGSYEPAVNDSNNRASFWVKTGRSGQAKVIMQDSDIRTDLCAIPVPNGVTKLSVIITPSTYYFSVRFMDWNENEDKWYWGTETGWQLESIENYDLPAIQDGYDYKYFIINVKFNSAGTTGNLPTGILVKFE